MSNTLSSPAPLRADTATPTLSFTGVVRRFGRLPVLGGVSATVQAGEVLLVTGRNGSGKSTLLKCLAGLLAADRGEIELRLGDRALSPRERRHAVGYAAPDMAYYEELSTRENLIFFARLRRVEEARVDELLERVGLPPDREAGALSSGMLQRLRWCGAVLHTPPLLLLDEPFQNLDEPGRDTGRQMLEEHLRHGLAVVANPGPLNLPYVTQHLQLAG